MDTQLFFSEQQELIEGFEVERDELIESESQDTFKVLLDGSNGNDFLIAQLFDFLNRLESNDLLKKVIPVGEIYKTNIPFFLMYCCLKLHII